MAEQLPLTFEFKANQTFDDYFPGSNQTIVDQLKNFAGGSGEEFIFLWGNPGYGKSHLLHASCHYAFQKGLSSFYFDLTETRSADPELLTGLEQFEIVCLDNIDNIQGHVEWELALFNFYNRQRDLKRKLLISALCAPNALNFKLPDLQSRINWGLALKIQVFDDKNKIAALTYKAQQKGFEIAPQAARFLLTHYDRKLSSLWITLEKIDSASLAAKRKLTIPFLKQIMEQNN